MFVNFSSYGYSNLFVCNLNLNRRIETCSSLKSKLIIFIFFSQVSDGIVLPDNASLYLTAIEDAEYKEDKIECK